MDYSIPETMDEAISKAAKYLPEGHIVFIRIEKDGYEVILEDDEFCTQTIDGGDGIKSDINEAILIARGENE